MRKLGVSESVIILADHPVQIGRTAAGIGYDKDRLSDLGFLILEKKHLINEPEKDMNKLIE